MRHEAWFLGLRQFGSMGGKEMVNLFGGVGDAVGIYLEDV